MWSLRELNALNARIPNPHSSTYQAEQWLISNWAVPPWGERQYDTLHLFFDCPRFDLAADYLYGAGVIDEGTIEYTEGKEKAAVIIKQLHRLLPNLSTYAPNNSPEIEFLTEIEAVYTVCDECNRHFWADDPADLVDVTCCTKMGPIVHF